MPTPSEQKALAFAAVVILLGGAVRVVRAGATPSPTPMEQQALARQASAAESAASAAPPRSRRSRSSKAARPARGAPPATGGVASTPSGSAGAASAVEQGIGGYPPPGPRIDVDSRPNRSARRGSVTSRR